MEESAFATLTPATTLSRLAFDDFVETNIAGLRQDQVKGVLASLRLAVEPQRKFDKSVFQLKLHLAHRDAFDEDSNAGDASDSLPEPESEVEKEYEEHGMIWEGCFLLGFTPSARDSELGWTVGKRAHGNTPYSADLLLCTRSFDKQHSIGLRNYHARFNFAPETGGFSIALSSRRADTRLTVDGEQVCRGFFMLNKQQMTVSFGKLEHEFKYSAFARTEEFEQLRNDMMIARGASKHLDVVVPTPGPVTRTIGHWTVGDPLGKGGRGKVFLGTSTSNQVVALKIMDLTTKNKASVECEVQINHMLTELAEEEDSVGRILRQIEVIRGAEDIVSVHQPVVPMTLAELIGSRSKGGSRGMSMEAASVVRDALVGVKFLHDRGWMHRDLKPTNIGLIGKPLRSVLLDIGTSDFLEGGKSSLEPQPGCGGTVTYLAPERELQPYRHTIDVWALGIIGYELTYGHHPFKFLTNPWRKGAEHENLRPAFTAKYNAAMHRLANDYKGARKLPTPNYIHLGPLLIKMLRHPWAQGNSMDRIDIDQALSGPVWGFFGQLPRS